MGLNLYGRDIRKRVCWKGEAFANGSILKFARSFGECFAPTRRVYIAVVLLLLLNACTSSTPMPTNPPSISTLGTVSPAAPVIPDLSLATPTAVLADGAAQVGVLLDPGPAPTPAPDPLHFVFPTPRPAPNSAWRPPLYPTPWALSPYDHFYFARPIAPDEVNWPLADYRYGGIFFENVIHTGVDIPVPMDTPVLAAGSGKVIWAGYGLYRGVYDKTDPYGIAVSIEHDFGYHGYKLYTIYGHMDRVDVAKGQYVQAGDVLGVSGITGKTTGPHLHFEVRIADNDYYTTRNPELWLVPPVGWGVLAARVLASNGWELLDNQLVQVRSVTTRQLWSAKTYGKGTVNSDPYYHENLVISDLPAGGYEIHISYGGVDYSSVLEIKPGTVTYVTFRGRDGYFFDPPPTPGQDFDPGATPTASK